VLRRLSARLRERYPPLCDAGAECAEAVLEELGRLPDVLAAAIHVDDPRVLTDHLAFGAAFLHARGVPAAALGVALEALSGPLGGLPRASGHLDAGRRWLTAAGRVVPPA
jgi:hypothetical protein